MTALRPTSGSLDTLDATCDVRDSGDVALGRYALSAELGRGAFGVVRRGIDRVTGREVAVKHVAGLEPHRLGRLRRETATMRLLRFPGVVELVDDGEEAGRYTIVMGLVPGTPFPGQPAPASWDGLAPVVFRLLAVLEGVHAAGVVHRDLKPSNVLVDAEGRPVILDFGLAGYSGGDGSLTTAGAILGTPRYLSPEAAAGRPTDGRSDLYSVAVMIYECFAGRGPFLGDAVGQLLRARLLEEPTPLGQLAPQVPEAVAAAVDRCLARDPAQRPRSARELIEWLGGNAAADLAPLFPWLGSRAPLHAVERAVDDKVPLLVLGGRGSGRSRVIAHAARYAATLGRRLVHATPSTRPFGSLAGDPALAPPGELELAPATEHVYAALRSVLQGDAVLLADDAHLLDPWTRGVLERLSGGARARVGERATPSGAVLATEGSATRRVVLRPLTRAEVAPVLDGPERLVHVTTDGAAELIRRTAGNPRRLWREVITWDRAGIGRWSGQRLAVTREGLDRLGFVSLATTGVARRRSPHRSGASSHHVSRDTVGDLPAHQLDLSTWVAMAWPHTSAAQLAALTGWPRWRVDGELDALAAAGLVSLSGGVASPLGESATAWPDERRQAAHAAIAGLLPAGGSGRLQHLAAAADLAALVDEVSVVAERLWGDGALGKARATLVEGLAAARLVAPAASGPLLHRLAQVALAEYTPLALETALYEHKRSDAAQPGITRLLELALETQRSVSGTLHDRLLELPFADDVRIERHRLALAFRMAVAVGPAAEHALLERMERYAEDHPSADARALRDSSRGILLYRRGDYRASAEAHASAAAPDVSTPYRLLALLNAASSSLEAGRLDDAEQQASEAVVLAARARTPFYEARGEWIRRTVAYRKGRRAQPDVGLVAAAREALTDELTALLELGEAAFAWRARRLEVARDLALGAMRRLRRVGREPVALYTQALAVLCGAPEAEDLCRRLAAGGLGTQPPGLALQTLACCPAAVDACGLSSEDLARLSQRLPAARRTTRLEVFSAAECLRRLSVALRRRGARPALAPPPVAEPPL